MGLDAVEIVMDVEDHFGITIQNTEAERIRTVGDLVTLVQDRISAAHKGGCSTLSAFLKLRATLRAVTGDNTLAIRPHQHIAVVLTVRQRRELWRHLADLLGSAPRDLQRPQWLRRILRLSVVALLGIALVVAVAIDIGIGPVTFALAAICIFCLYVATVPFCTIPPEGWVTFGDVANRIVGVTMATKNLEFQTADNILCELRTLIVGVTGVDADEIVPDARFREDIGVG